MSDHMLDTDGIRALLSWDHVNDEYSEDKAARFDHWLAEHDREVAKQALEDAAEHVAQPGVVWFGGGDVKVYEAPWGHTPLELSEWLRARAATLSTDKNGGAS